MKTFFFFLESTCACVLGPWPRAFLSLASRVSVLGKAVLGLRFFFVSLSLASSLVSSTPPLKGSGIILLLQVLIILYMVRVLLKHASSQDSQGLLDSQGSQGSLGFARFPKFNVNPN